jgi:gluconolactonase
MWQFERVAGPYGFTEGPVWEGETLLFSDIQESVIRRYDPRDDSCEVHREGTDGANGLKFGPDGHLHACETDTRRVTRYERDGSRTVVADAYEGARLNSPNDLAFDGDGALWFTDPRYGDQTGRELDHRSVYRVDDDGALRRTTRGTTQPNGILVSPDDRTLYVAQSDYDAEAPTELRAYPMGDGELGEYRVLHDFHPHRGVDGMALDEAGNVVACAGWHESGPGPAVYVFAPTGRVLARHSFPGGEPTNCAFGDEDLRTLYVTDSEGSLYRARADRTGLLGAPDDPVA